MATKGMKQLSPLSGKQISSPVATSGTGAMYQARTQALYLANMLTGLPTVPALDGGRVRSIRFEARYTGAHTDDIYCEVDGLDGSNWRCFVQCKLSIEVADSNVAFKEAFQGAWRDWRDETEFRRARDVLSITSTGPAPKSVSAARQICELARASSDARDLLSKLEAPGLKSARVRETWKVLVDVSRETLGDSYSDEELYQFVKCLRFDVHDVDSAETQEMALLASLLGSWCAQPEQGQLLLAGLTDYCFEMGRKPGTATAVSWRTSASAALQRAFDTGTAGASGLAASWNALFARSQRQLTLISASLPNGVRLERLNLKAAVLDAVGRDQVVLLAGEPGVGKSGVLVSVAPILAESGPLIFFRGDELDGGSLDAALVSAGVPLGVPALHAAMAAYSRMTLVIDSMEKALEYSKRGALEELLALAAKHESVRLVVTTRSHSVTPLLTNFLHAASIRIVPVPVFNDEEITKVFAASDFSFAEHSDERLHSVLRVPFYLRLAVSHHMRGFQLFARTEGDLRKHLWLEGVAPSASTTGGLSERRRKVFDAVCFNRTEKLSQFVEAPDDAEAVAALLHDGIIVIDTHGRVSPAHDVFEDWSLFFRVEREVASAEQDWAAFFSSLGTHSGLRRAFRAWTAEQADSNNADALSVLDYCLAPSIATPLWRDEAVIGLLRSEACNSLLRRFEALILSDNFELLKRMIHVLRVACKGPASLQAAPLEGSERAKEERIRFAMTVPVGAAWAHVVAFVDQHKESLPKDAWLWVVPLLEDACSDKDWNDKTPLSHSVFNLADFYLSNFDESWSGNNSLPKRFFSLFIRKVVNMPERAKEYFDRLIGRVEAATAANRDIDAEERLAFALTFVNSPPLSAVIPSTVCRALVAMCASDNDKKENVYHQPTWQHEQTFGFGDLGVSNFFPASGMTGPFRHLLSYSLDTTVRCIIELANKSARKYQATNWGYVSVLPVSKSPNSREHLHAQEFWHCYRGMSFTGEFLASALMALEARLLFDADENLPDVLATLEWIIEYGISTLTTAVVVSVIAAKPDLVSVKLTRLMQSPEFFLADRRRMSGEFGVFALQGGNDGLDTFRQQERIVSNRLPHRKTDLERLMLRLQFERPSLCGALFAILDEHVRELNSVLPPEQDDSWRIALKRMDRRGLLLGAPVGDGGNRTLEIAHLDDDLAKKSDLAAEHLTHETRRANLELWIASATSPSDCDFERFSTPTEVLKTLRAVCEAENDEEAEFRLGLDHKVAAALVMTMFGQDATCDRWAMDMLLDPATSLRKARFERPDIWALHARAVTALAVSQLEDFRIGPALAFIAGHKSRKVRFALADAVGASQNRLPSKMVESIALGLARYAQLTNQALESHQAPCQEAQRDIARLELESRLAGAVLPEPLLETPIPNPEDWAIALHAARGRVDWHWRTNINLAMFGMVATSEGSQNTRRTFDVDARNQVARLFASELLRTDVGNGAARALFKTSLETAPELCSAVLSNVLQSAEGGPHYSRDVFWSIWDSAVQIVFKMKVPRSALGSQSTSVGLLRELLFVGSNSYPWREGLHHLTFFDERPTYVTDCLRQVGGTQLGIQACLELMCGVGRQTAIPAAIPALRNAIHALHSALLTATTIRHVETVCRLVVHEHREELKRNKPLRDATLDILNNLVEAGSSIAFQLRDYLATMLLRA